MLYDFQSEQIQRFKTGGINPITGETIPDTGCIPLSTSLTGLTITQSPANAAQLDITGTATAVHQELLIPGNYVNIGGAVRRIKYVNQFFLQVTVDYPFAATVTAQQLKIAKKTAFRMLLINNTTSVTGYLQEAEFQGNITENYTNPAQIECIGYDATGTVYDFTVGI